MTCFSRSTEDWVLIHSHPPLCIRAWGTRDGIYRTIQDAIVALRTDLRRPDPRPLSRLFHLPGQCAIALISCPIYINYPTLQIFLGRMGRWFRPSRRTGCHRCPAERIPAIAHPVERPESRPHVFTSPLPPLLHGVSSCGIAPAASAGRRRVRAIQDAIVALQRGGLALGLVPNPRGGWCPAGGGEVPNPNRPLPFFFFSLFLSFWRRPAVISPASISLPRGWAWPRRSATS